MRSRFGVLACVFASFTVLQLVAAIASFASEIRRESLSSKYLGDDLSFLVYLPQGYEGSGKRYPVLYLLHGFGDNERAWVERGKIRKKADRLIATGAIPPALIVMPGCPRCWWADGERRKTETAFWEELVPAVANRYRVIGTREGRLIAGLSAGGYGAIRLSMKYPDRFAAVAALSPAIYAETPPEDSAARESSPFVDIDGRFSQAAWAARNYPELIEPYFSAHTAVPIYLVSGDDDPLGIAFETALFFKRIAARQPDLVELRVVDGGHTWAVWSNAVEEAMRYVFRFAARPVPAQSATRDARTQQSRLSALP